MNQYIFDGHKLMYHPDRVAAYLADGDCYPFYMEISPIGLCNHRCVFCAYDFIGYPNRKINSERMLMLLDELADCGVKSILFAGEGEPLLHPDIIDFILRARDNGIDIGLYTNGQNLKNELAQSILPALSFVRFSFNGGSRNNYAAIHSVRNGVFDTVVENIRNASSIKHKSRLQVDIGAQFVLITENIDYLTQAAKTLKECGIDYLAIKPFVQQSQHQGYQAGADFTQEKLECTLQAVESLSTDEFVIMPRRESFREYGERNYKRCYGASFISVLNSAGDIATCLPYWEKPEYVYGNIYKSTFKEIWSSEKRTSIKEHLENCIDVSRCPPNCRPNFVNEFLYQVRHPNVKHINFI